jgi:hypothetical protein
MKIERIAAIGMALVLLYAATSMAHLRAASMDVCCNESNDCTAGYACDKSGDTCEPNLTGKCIKIVEVIRLRVEEV